jgi:hypothetical protein
MYQNAEKYTNAMTKKLPVKYIYHMVIKYTKMAVNIFLSYALQINPNWDFWYENIPSGNRGLFLGPPKTGFFEWNVVVA